MVSSGQQVYHHWKLERLTRDVRTTGESRVSSLVLYREIVDSKGIPGSAQSIEITVIGDSPKKAMQEAESDCRSVSDLCARGMRVTSWTVPNHNKNPKEEPGHLSHLSGSTTQDSKSWSPTTVSGRKPHRSHLGPTGTWQHK
ncbi:hypothetical protein RRG08_033004 [Elysia crispata]|uniref:Uncharacterized protein n=1 Tax=Elysia crispata TaxID=231223 RepID=A0AAE1D3M4_9GAST|nr:hypothetical protein RRG08_033004 [Elysia crispata]